MLPLRNFCVRQALLACAHGLSLLLALSPFDIWPLGLIAPIAVLAAAASLYQARISRILITWLFFACATTFITFGWIPVTIHRFTGGVVFLSLVLALAYACVFQLKFLVIFALARLWQFGAYLNFSRLLAAAVLIVIAELAAPELFPWSWGNGTAAFSWLRQLASVGSVYLASAATVLLGLLAWQIFWVMRAYTWQERGRAHARALAFVAALVTGGAILYYWPLPAETGTLRTLVVQTNIGAAPEKMRSNREFATDAINRLFNQSLEGALLHWPLHLIIWPEASMPFHSADRALENRSIYSPTFDAIAEYLSRRTGAALIFQDMYQTPVGLFSRLAVRPEIGTKNYYLKRRLVPWGEFLPFGNLYPELRRLFPEAGRYVPATELNEISLQISQPSEPIRSLNQISSDLQYLADSTAVRSHVRAPPPQSLLRAKPVICYEALFPADARTSQAQLILNLASDAWFGDGIEGHQHASAAMMRAVENGIPMVRAAMSGVTAIVDAKGDDIVPRSLQATVQNIFAEIPLQRRTTVFSRFGMAAFWLLAFACLWPWLLDRFIFAYIAKNK